MKNQTLYVDEIMIRAYLYARNREHVDNFEQFIDTFLNPDLSNAQESLRVWLKEEFGIEFRSNKSLSCSIDQKEEDRLFNELRDVKGAPERARNDARLILTIHAIREANNEQDTLSIFGYRTWWLSKDTKTQRAVEKVFKDKYAVGCYIRPDFLYNYIALAPRNSDVDSAYREMFPSLIGVNISFHMPGDVVAKVQEKIKDHKRKNPARVKAILHELGERLKSDPGLRGKQRLEHYLDERLREVETSGA
jgi:hypothetical protein